MTIRTSVSAQAVADRVLHIHDRRADITIAPCDQQAVIIPAAILAELDLGDALFDQAAEVWDVCLRRALTEAVAQVLDLAGK